MQFYIIHPNPTINANLLPKYALEKVNLREGWQILSDIGHIHGVTWEGQNKLYSASHVLTRSFCQNRQEFTRFLDHYEACVKKRPDSSWYKKFHAVFEVLHDTLKDAVPEYRTREEFALEYLLSTKAKHLTEVEIGRLVRKE